MAAEASIRAIGRGLKVLQVINQHRSLSMMSIAKLCDLPYPTACRIVETLIEEQMIERESARKFYRPTALVKTLSAGFQEDDALAQVSRRHIVNLTREVRWPVTLCTRVGMSMMIRDSTHAIAPFTLNIYHPGFTIPLLESSSGKVYLAFSREDDQNAILDHVRRTNVPNAERVVPRLQAALEDIRTKGYSIQERIRHTANPGKTSAISVPIMGDGPCEATVTLAFFSSSMTLPRAVETYIPSIKQAACLIAQDMAELRLGH